MISDEEIQAWADDLTEEEPLKHALLELLAHRKAWSKPAGAIPADDIQWLNRGGKAEISIHWINSDGSLPLYRKPSTD